MNSPPLRRKIFLLAAFTLAFYVAAFYGIEWWRAKLGPWEVTFTSSTNHPPTLVIRQPRLGIEKVEIIFEGESAPPTNLLLRFDHPIRTVPWGTVVHQDPVKFPGVVTLHLFGHEVEMMPRVLSLNRRAVPWSPHASHRLAPQDKLPPDQLIRKKFKRELGLPPAHTAGS
ncbi:hypothetical protein NXS98_03535 [Fontisphaera persica]|uniref:hypothetical protein n=1 Tax=Fontisphaera persica TaxID=2974023 RepID=UPI0024BF32D4|nr:hypothetical protein [Fontisphaera persica]WCJ60213.1 hypothetical protein NXS98_03535 [Fontisphaera persica]